MAFAVAFPERFAKLQTFAAAVVAFIASIIAYQSAQQAARTQAEAATANSRMQIDAAMRKEREQEERLRRHVLVRVQVLCLAYSIRLASVKMEIETILNAAPRENEGRTIGTNVVSLMIGRLRHNADFEHTLTRDEIGLSEVSLVDIMVQHKFYIMTAQLLELSRAAKAVVATVETKDLLTVSAIEMLNNRCDLAELACNSAMSLLGRQVEDSGM